MQSRIPAPAEKTIGQQANADQQSALIVGPESVLEDNRSEALVQRRVQAIANTSPRTMQLKAMQAMVASSNRIASLQRKEAEINTGTIENKMMASAQQPIQLLAFQGSGQLNGKISGNVDTADAKSVTATNISGKVLDEGVNGTGAQDLGNYGALQNAYDFSGAYILTRMHLLNGRLGGDGKDPANLAWGTANFNNPVMYQAVEIAAQNCVHKGHAINSYHASVQFDSTRDDDDPLRWWPTEWYVKWDGSDGSGKEWRESDILPASKKEEREFIEGTSWQDEEEAPKVYTKKETESWHVPETLPGKRQSRAPKHFDEIGDTSKASRVPSRFKINVKSEGAVRSVSKANRSSYSRTMDKSETS